VCGLISSVKFAQSAADIVAAAFDRDRSSMRIDAGLGGASGMSRAARTVRRRTARFSETRNDPNVAKNA